MSFLRALRRCKTYDINAAEQFGSVLRCFDISSRRNVVEPFVVGRDCNQEEEGSVMDTCDEPRLYRTAISKDLPDEGSGYNDTSPLKPSPPRPNIDSAYHNLWNVPPPLKSDNTSAPVSVPLLEHFPKIQGHATASPARLLHTRMQEILTTVVFFPYLFWSLTFDIVNTQNTKTNNKFSRRHLRGIGMQNSRLYSKGLYWNVEQS